MTNEHPIGTQFTESNAVEMGRAGGKAKSIIKTWNARVNCDAGCVFFDRCPAISTSMALPVTKRNKHPCVIKSYQPEVRNYFRSLFNGGDEGLIKIIMELHFRLLVEVGKKPSVKILKEAIETSIQIKKAVYGDKSQNDQTIVNVIVSNQVDV